MAEAVPGVVDLGMPGLSDGLHFVRPPEIPFTLVPEADAPMEPWRQVIVFVNSRCDLACPECPVYFLEDTRSDGQPRQQSDQVLEYTGRAIDEHAVKHDLETMDVVLFGGEPCAAGIGPIRKTVETLRANTPNTELTFRVTTNGIRLAKDPELRAYLKEIGCKVAISLDGDEVLNDKYRQHHQSKKRGQSLGTYNEITAAIRIWNEENPDNHAGILVTMHDPRDPDNDPKRIYDAVAKLEPRAMDFLFNHGEVAKADREPPVQNFYDIDENVPTLFGDWLIEMYTYHQSLPPEKRMPVRMFEAIEDVLHGGPSLSSTIGITAMTMIAVSTAGGIELDVAYNGAYDGAADTGLSVAKPNGEFNEGVLDKALRHPLVVANQMDYAGLSKTCQACPVVEVCGGGQAAHRYWRKPSANKTLSEIARRFDWPAASCADLGKFVLHVMRDIASRPGLSEDVQELVESMPTWPPSQSENKMSYAVE